MSARLVLMLLALGLATSLAPRSAQAAHVPADLAEHWLHVGFDRPDAALAALDRALAAQPAQTRLWHRTRALVAARAGRHAMVDAVLESLRGLERAGDPLAAADAHLVRAVQADQRGQSARSAGHAQDAQQAYQDLCATEGPQCDPFGAWQALSLLLRHEADEGDVAAASTHAAQAAALAQRSGDLALRARSLATQGWLRARAQQGAESRRLLERADAMLRGAGRADAQARVALMASAAAAALDDQAGVERAVRTARAHARAADSPRLEALALTNLSDLLLRRGRAGEAFSAVQRALPVARRHDDRRIERVLLHNGALALLGLGRVAEARVHAERMLELWSADGSLGEQAMALREVADALADTGHPRAALELHHRERALNAQLMASQRESAERSLRVRYDRDNDQRRIELAARDNAIAASELNNQRLAQRLWALAAAVVAAAALLVGLLLQRVRATQRSLQRSQAQLRVQSECDPLTGTANRRCGQQHLAEVSAREAGAGAAPAYRGALLMVDVDHFKRINDGHGHAVGDQVLVEVARRLQAAVREHDLVVRWGGEEFLVVAPGVEGEALDELARRLLRAVSGSPIALAAGGAIMVTVSIGHAAFPLEPGAEPIGWERALNLTDMALYTAKSQGRHRAVGVQALAKAPDALARAEADFEKAWSDGYLSLKVQAG